MGKLFTCLFGESGFDVIGPIRDGYSDEQIRELITSVWNKRDDRYSEIRASITDQARRKVEMYQIGG